MRGVEPGAAGTGKIYVDGTDDTASTTNYAALHTDNAGDTLKIGGEEVALEATGGLTLRLTAGGSGSLSIPSLGISCSQAQSPCYEFVTTPQFQVEAISFCEFLSWGELCQVPAKNSCSHQCLQSASGSCQVDLNAMVDDINGGAASFAELPSTVGRFSLYASWNGICSQ